VANGRGGVVDPDLTTILASDQIPPNGSNTTHYRNAIVDRDLKTRSDDARQRQAPAILRRDANGIGQPLPILPQRGRFAGSRTIRA